MAPEASTGTGKDSAPPDQGAKEPQGSPDAPADMSAHLRTEGAPPSPAAPRPIAARPANPGDAAFDRWLRRELTRLYDDALSEPVPDELLRLLRDNEPKKQ